MKRRSLSLLLAVALLWALGFSTIAREENAAFSDVAADAWYADAVAYVRDHGLMSGTSATTFSPHTTTSRAMLAAILYRRAGSPAAGPADFTDVPADAWYAPAAGWAAAEGIVGGYGDGRFGPNDPVTREQLAAILWRSAGSPAPTGTAAFADRASIAAFAAPAVSWAREQGIVSGKAGNRFAPQGRATRAELAVMLHRWLRAAAPPASAPDQEDASMPTLTIQAGGRSFTVSLEDNATTRAFVAALPMKVTMGELNGNEKYYYLPKGLPANSQRPGAIQTGDLMLYGSDCLVLFYETFSSGYSYTRMGRVDDPSGLASALGGGSVEVSFSANG